MNANAHFQNIVIGKVAAVDVSGHHRREPSMTIEMWSPKRGRVTIDLPITLATILHERIGAALRRREKDDGDVAA